VILTTEQLAEAVADSFRKARETVDFGFRDCDYFWRFVAIKMQENYPQVLCVDDAENPDRIDSVTEALLEQADSEAPCKCGFQHVDGSRCVVPDVADITTMEAL
jgi:hypothetical protein